jgi:hypothetical protein
MYYRKIVQPDTTFPEGFGREEAFLCSMFAHARIRGFLKFPAGFAQKAQNMMNMFRKATLYGDIDWSETEFEDLGNLYVKDMFYGTEFNGHHVIVANEDIRQKFITRCIAPASAIVLKGAEITQDTLTLNDGIVPTVGLFVEMDDTAYCIAAINHDPKYEFMSLQQIGEKINGEWVYRLGGNKIVEFGQVDFYEKHLVDDFSKVMLELNVTTRGEQDRLRLYSSNGA